MLILVITWKRKVHIWYNFHLSQHDENANGERFPLKVISIFDFQWICVGKAKLSYLKFWESQALGNISPYMAILTTLILQMIHGNELFGFA